MDYKEKVRLAKETLESGSYDKETIYYIFPELKESEDERVRKELLKHLREVASGKSLELSTTDYERWATWVEKQGAKVSAIEGFETEFERQVSGLIASALNKEHEYNQGYVKWTANALLNYAKHKLEKQGERMSDPRYSILDKLIEADGIYQMAMNDAMVQEAKTKAIDALSKLEIGKLLEIEKQGEQKPVFEMKTPEESLGIDSDTYNKIVDECIYGEQKPVWSEEDYNAIETIACHLDNTDNEGMAEVLRNIRDKYYYQNKWKPSEEHYELEEFAKIVRSNLTGISKAVQKLFEAKYLQLTGNKMYQGFKD